MKAILIVEDNPADLELISMVLKDQGVAITAAPDGESALEVLSAQSIAGCGPQLVLLDLGLPRMSGHQVLEELRSGRNSVPVVVLSTSATRADVAKSYALGANSHVQKPTGLAAYELVAQRIIEYWFEFVELDQVPN